MTMASVHGILGFLILFILLLLRYTDAQGVPLAGGRFQSTTVVTGWLNLALDVANMRDTDDSDVKLDIYSQGQNSEYINDNGETVTRSLASLSLEAYPLMKYDVMYNFFRHAFSIIGNEEESEKLGNFDDQPVEQYADTLVQDLFDLDVPQIEAEAALIMNVWMYITHQLYDMLNSCWIKADKDEMHAALDVAAALWIGADQPEGDADRGNMLYNLAQIAGRRYGEANGEAQANRLVIDGMNTLQLYIQGNKCDTEQGYMDVRMTVNNIIGAMTIPLVQQLLHHIAQQPAAGGSDFIELYSLSIAPRILLCDHEAYDFIMDNMVFGEVSPDVESKKNATRVLQSVYDCLGITCEQVGSYETGSLEECSDAPPETPSLLAGYPPTFDISQYARLDRDIIQMRTLAATGATDAALDLYWYGFNSKQSETQYLSLGDLAISSDREAVEQFSLFSSYFGTTDQADETITDTLNQEPKYANASPFQIGAIAGDTATSMVTYMTALQMFYSSIQTCSDGGPGSTDKSIRLWDQGVALVIGSTEGTHGIMLYGVAKSMCAYFGTCIDSGGAEINGILVGAFKQGSDMLTLGNCDEAGDLVENTIVGALQVPLIQGTLHYAAINAALQAGATNSSLGSGFAFAESILPLVDQANPDSAVTIFDNMDFDLTSKPVNSGASAVFDAFRDALPGMAADCSLIGSYQVASLGALCPGSGSGGPPSGPPSRGPSPGGPTPTPAPTTIEDASAMGFGRYVFTNNVTGLANIAYDVRDVAQAATIADASAVYNNGANSQVMVDGTLTTVYLAWFSQAAATYMQQEPTFNLFRYALLNDTAFQDGAPAIDSAFGDVVVQKAFDVAQDIELASEASVVMNVWMEITHHLYQTIQLCTDGQIATLHLDEAFALWLGTDQKYSSTDGYLMYSLAQRAAGRMGRGSGEAQVNTDLFELFNAAKELTESCADDSSSTDELRMAVARIVRVMTIPLLQNLIYYIHRDMETDVTNKLELYTLSVLPQAIGCDPDVFFYLEDVLLDGDTDFADIDDAFFDNMILFQKCLRVTCNDIIDGEISDQALRSTVTALCYEEEQTSSVSVAGYNATTDISEYLRLDLDVLQIGIFMETGAYDAARSWYLHGHNHKGGVAFRDLVRARSLKNVPHYQVFKDYYGVDDFADDIVMSALNQAGNFASASRSQLTESAVTTLQGMVSYLLILDSLQKAVATCEAGGAGLSNWDRAVAFFVGSIEGERRGGNNGDYGQLLYALGKDMCVEFNTCKGSGDAAVNEELLDAFADGQVQIIAKSCGIAKSIVEDKIIPALAVSLVQGTLFYADSMDNLQQGSPDEILGTGFAVSRAVAPLVNAVDSTSAETIDTNMDFQPDLKPLPAGSDAIFDAITASLPGMGISCQQIGSLKGRSTCADGTELRPHSGTSTTLADGLYTTTTYVQDRANIALDVLAIRNALDSGSPDLAALIYKDGENSPIYNENGVRVGQRSLQKFSTEAPETMTGEPEFTFFRFALGGAEGMYRGKDAGVYADTIVSAAFQNKKPTAKTLAAEAMVALNLWMYLDHELHETLENCKKKVITDNDGVQSIDEAAAYWIGDGQITGDPQQGHLLYALAEQTAELFNSDENGQARANRNILRLFNQAKLELSFPDACRQNPATFPRLRQIINKIEGWMTVPLVQSLIHNLRQNDRDRVELYAQAFVPLVVGCNPSAFEYLNDKLISMTYNVVEVEEIVERIQSTYQCFGLRCEDIGVYQADTAADCVDPGMTTALGGYSPQSDVRPFALLDLDILHASILMEMNAVEAAREIYTYGKHAVVEGADGPETLSFYHLASTAQRTVVPQFDSFTRYYESDKYADVFIQQAFNPDEIFGTSSQQRREIVVKTMQFIIIYMTSLQVMHEAIADCQSTDTLRLEDAEESWDRAAALLIGSLEGSENGGSGSGLLFHALANERCTEFNTCIESGRADVNERLISLLYTGRGAVTGRSCGALRKAVREIEPLLLVPLIQSTLHYALVNERLSKGTQDTGFAAGYVFSRSLLPLIDDVNRNAAATIGRNMDFQFEETPVTNGAGAVFAEFAKVYGPIGVDCELVGTGDSFDACKGASKPGGPKDTYVGFIVGLVVGILAVIGIVWIVFFAKKRRMRKELENRPVFLTPTKGELNHDADFLNGVHDAVLARDLEKTIAMTPESAKTSSTEGSFT